MRRSQGFTLSWYASPRWGGEGFGKRNADSAVGFGEVAEAVFDFLRVVDPHEAGFLGAMVAFGIRPESGDEDDITGPVIALATLEFAEAVGEKGSEGGGAPAPDKNGAAIGDGVDGPARGVMGPERSGEHGESDEHEWQSEQREGPGHGGSIGLGNTPTGGGHPEDGEGGPGNGEEEGAGGGGSEVVGSGHADPIDVFPGGEFVVHLGPEVRGNGKISDHGLRAGG